MYPPDYNESDDDDNKKGRASKLCWEIKDDGPPGYDGSGTEELDDKTNAIKKATEHYKKQADAVNEKLQVKVALRILALKKHGELKSLDKDIGK